MPTKEYYLEKIEKEFRTARRALQEGNPGMARVCSRRAAGVAIGWFLTTHPRNGWGTDAMTQLNSLKADPSFSDEVREAAVRMTTKITDQFTYPFSTDPVNDGKIIVDFITRIMASDVS